MTVAINRHRLVLLCASVLLVLSASFRDAEARDEVILHPFAKAEGYGPRGTPAIDSSGNLYGTNASGGSHCRHYGCGTVFKLTPDGTETTLHTFAGKQAGDGDEPIGPLVTDKSGAIYGTTGAGGSKCIPGLRSGGCGTIFRIDANGVETILHAFRSLRGGVFPSSGVTLDKNGDLYGTTYEGGLTECKYGCGTVFRLSPSGDYEVLHAFSMATEGGYPSSGVLIDSAGNLYGETGEGGNSGCSGNGCGTIYRLARDGTFTVLYTFLGGSDGEGPDGGLIFDNLGSLYGVTANGGANNGTVFKIGSDGSETILYRFAGGSDGSGPFAALVTDKKGNLFGTTYVGGGSGCDGFGCGTVFQMTPEGTEKILHAFANGSDGALPVGGLIMDQNHNLYGTTIEGGSGCGCGTVFELKN